MEKLLESTVDIWISISIYLGAAIAPFIWSIATSPNCAIHYGRCLHLLSSIGTMIQAEGLGHIRFQFQNGIGCRATVPCACGTEDMYRVLPRVFRAFTEGFDVSVAGRD